MTEWVMRNFDKAVLEKLKLSPEARAAFGDLLRGRLIRKDGGAGAKGGDARSMDTDFGLYSGA